MGVVPGQGNLDQVVAEEARSPGDQQPLAGHPPQVGAERVDHGGQVAVAHLGGA